MSMSSRIEIPIVSTKRSLAKLFAQVLRFCLVGGLNTFVDVLVFNLLVLGLPTQDNGLLVIYNSLAYLVGAVNSFCWNKLWTF
ncbi:MAG: GtrA family protein, partial [Chloroflexi bacterium]